MPVTGFGEIAEHLRRSTVLVLPGARGNGSGVIWSADGAIITNAHVARGSQARVQLWDGRELEAAVVSRDLRRDLAELRVIGINTMVAGRLALAIPSNTVTNFLRGEPADAYLGVVVEPVRVPRPGSRAKTFGLVLLDVEPDSPAANASLLPGDILLGTEEKSFASVDDLASSLQGSGPRLLRLAFLRGDYEHFRRVTVQLGAQRIPRSAAAA